LFRRLKVPDRQTPKTGRCGKREKMKRRQLFFFFFYFGWPNIAGIKKKKNDVKRKSIEIVAPLFLSLLSCDSFCCDDPTRTNERHMART
jgi:hypothetical protein